MVNVADKTGGIERFQTQALYTPDGHRFHLGQSAENAVKGLERRIGRMSSGDARRGIHNRRSGLQKHITRLDRAAEQSRDKDTKGGAGWGKARIPERAGRYSLTENQTFARHFGGGVENKHNCN